MCSQVDDDSFEVQRMPPIRCNSTATCRFDGIYCVCDDLYAYCKRCRNYELVASLYDRLCNKCKHPRFTYSKS